MICRLFHAWKSPSLSPYTMKAKNQALNINQYV